MEVHFRKYHGLGNDYLVIDPNIHDVALTPDTIRSICDRNFGIGADGILYGPIKSGDNLSLRIFNPDGSEAEKSGNGLRIFAKYLFDNRYVNEKHFSIETLGGIVEAYIEDDSVNLIKINMGKMTFRSAKIPVRKLFVEISENEDIYLTGAVEGVFEGRFHLDLKEKILRMK